MAASLVAPERPAAWSHYGSAWWVSENLIAEAGLLAWCRDDDWVCQAKSQRLMEAARGWSCQLAGQRTAWNTQGPNVTATLYVVPPSVMANTIRKHGNDARCSALM
jgi:hypothetical protein